jgi:hypothetical protein
MTVSEMVSELNGMGLNPVVNVEDGSVLVFPYKLIRKGELFLVAENIDRLGFVERILTRDELFACEYVLSKMRNGMDM